MTMTEEQMRLFELLAEQELAELGEAQTIPRLAPGAERPMSFAQERLWLLDRLEPGNSAFNMPVALKLSGALDTAALARAFREIVRRHETLRTFFRVAEDRPVQVTVPVAEVAVGAVPVVDLGRLPESVREPLAERLAGEEAARSFDLAAAPPIRLGLLRLAPREHVLLLTMHHILSDGWSIGVLTRELGTLYETFRNGAPSPLPELPLQYADFAAWQRQWLTGEALEEQLGYWRQQLGGLDGSLELPTDRPRAAVQTYRGGTRALTLDADLAGRLDALSRRHNASLFMTLLAGFKVLLGRLAGETDVAVGTPIAGRDRAEIQDLIGIFLNTLVLRTRVDGAPSFDDLLERVKQTTLGAYAHQEIPIEKLIDELQPQRDLSRPPWFQVFFNMLNLPVREARLPDLTLTPMANPDLASKFDLTVYARQQERGIRLEVVYNADLFDGGRIDEMLRQYERLLAQAAEDPSRPVGELDLVTAAARPRLPDSAAALEATWPGAVHELFARAARRHPDAPALLDEASAWTYGELDEAANRLAQRLRAAGVGAGDPVAIWAHRSAALPWAMLGVLKAGAAFVVLDPAHPPARAVEILRLARPRAFLRVEAAGALPEEVAAGLAALGAACELALPPSWTACRERGFLAEDSPEDPALPVAPDDLAYVAFTSGSTGVPKGILGRHAPLAHYPSWLAKKYGLDGGARYGMLSGLSHDPLLRDVFPALTTGATLCIPDPEEMLTTGWLADWMRRREVTVVNLTPAMGRVLTERGAGPAVEVPELRLALFVGEALTVGDVARLRRLAPRAVSVNLYGATETQQALSSYEVPATDGDPRQVVPLGRGIDGVQLLVLGGHGRLAGVGEVGEICFRSPCLARGYLADEALTAERFAGGGDGARLYRTGDLGRYRPDGEVTFAGRRDRQVKIRGFRIELGEIETRLGEAPGVEQAVVLALETAAELRLAAFVVGTATVEELRAFLETRLPSYMIPSVFVPLEALPLTPNGKVDRAALARRDLPAPDRAPAGETVAPRTPAEEMLAAIWRQVLGVERLGVHDNFFKLGGHSLLAAQLMSRVERAFGVALPMRRLFEKPTVAELAAVVTELRGHGPRETDAWLPALAPSPAGQDEPFPLTDIQGAYWVGRSEGLELGAGATHRYFELESPDLDLPRFERAWQRLVERHGMLRAVVTSDGRQQILPAVPPYEIRVLDLTGEERESAEAKLAAVRDELSHQVLPTDHWPLFDIRASRLGGRVRIHFSIDLLIGDAWSFQLLTSELGRLYADPDTVLTPLEISFRDYVLAEVALRESPLYERALAYWRDRLRTLPPAPELPLAKAPESIRQPHFVRRQGRLDRERWARLQQLGTAAGLTSSAVLLTAFAEVLACWSKSPRFTINLTLFNRLPLHPQVNQLVGDFTSVTLLEVDHTGSDCFAARARRLLERLWDDLDHRLVSGVRVLRERRRLQAGAGIMPVVFTSTLNLAAAEPAGGRAAPGLEGEVLFGVSQTSQVWIDHQVTEAAGELSYSWDVVDELFPEGMVDAMFAAYRRLLERLTDGEEVWHERIGADLLVPAGQLAERARVNATAAPLPAGLLHRRILDQARRQPDRPAVIAGGRQVTYGELLAGSERLARELRRRGAKPNRLVAVVMEKGWEQVLGVLGILRAGAAYLPVDPHLPHERLHFLLEHAEAEIALTQPRFADGLEWPAGVDRVALDESWLAGEPAGELEEPVQTPEDLAYVIFTSGSTGLPKGVMIDHRGALNTVVDVNERFAVGAADRVLGLSALNFDLSVYDVFGPLAVGAAVVLPEPEATRDPSRWAELVREHGVTIWNTVPALMEMLVEYAAGQSELSLPSLRLVMMSGDWIPVTLPDRIESLTGRRRVGGLPADDGEIQVISLGGATEASIWSILYPIEEVTPGWASIPYGVPMVNQSFAVLDDALDPRPLWTPGQLFIGGIGLAKGYWRDPEKTAASFITHPRSGERLYRTGDLGRYLPGGAIEFLGREDFQVKVQGHRIELGEIEVALLRHPAIRAAVATAAGDARGQKRLVAYLVLDDGSEATAEEIRAFLEGKLPEYMVPAVFLFLEELPLTANGKVDRKALPAPEALEAKTEYEAPRNEIERQLAEIWREQLGAAEIGIHDNFFELGGDSLMAIRVITKAGEAGIRLEPRHVFEHQTIAELSPLAEEVAPAEAEPSWTEEEPPSSEPDFADSGLAPDQLDKVLAKLKGIS